MKRPSENPFIRFFRRTQTVIQPFLPIGEHHEHQKIRTLRHHHPFYCHPAPFRISRHRYCKRNLCFSRHLFLPNRRRQHRLPRAHHKQRRPVRHRFTRPRPIRHLPDPPYRKRERPRLPTRRPCLCILAKQHTQPRLPQRHPGRILPAEPEIQDIAGKRKSRNTLFHLPAERRRNRLQQHRKSDRLPLKPDRTGLPLTNSPRPSANTPPNRKYFSDGLTASRYPNHLRYNRRRPNGLRGRLKTSSIPIDHKRKKT